jgi:hypothetical protein
MIEFLTAGPNLLFTIVLTLMGTIALMEIIGALLGISVSDYVDSVLPDTPDISLEGAEAVPSLFSSLLGWLLIGRVPILILLIIFLTAFGIIGLILQAMTLRVVGRLLPAGVIALPALIAAVAGVKSLGGLLANVLLKDETSAVSEALFIGKIATITLGTAKRGQPAQAKLQDQYGQTHYVLVEPDREDETFDTGTAVVLVERNGVVFHAVRWIE